MENYFRDFSPIAYPGGRSMRRCQISDVRPASLSRTDMVKRETLTPTRAVAPWVDDGCQMTDGRFHLTSVICPLSSDDERRPDRADAALGLGRRRALGRRRDGDRRRRRGRLGGARGGGLLRLGLGRRLRALLGALRRRVRFRLRQRLR